MNGNVASAFSYLVGTLIDLYIAAILLRLLLQWVRADFYNPVCQFLVKVTNPVLVPLRRIIPSIGHLDTASVVLMLALEVAGTWVITQFGPVSVPIEQVMVFSVFKLLATLLWTYFFLIIAMVILSWFGQRLRHPIIPLVYQLTEPVLAPIRKVIPAIGGIDLSPLLAIVAIRFFLLLLGW